MRRHEPKQRCKRERSRTVRVFMVSYALAFAVLCGFAFLAVAALRPQEKPELVQEPSAYLPEAGDERTLLVLFVGEDASPVGCTLISLSALRKEVPVVTLPAQTLLTLTQREYTVAGLFGTGGAGCVADAAEETFGITVDGYIQLDPQSLAGAIDAVGPVEFNMPFAIGSGGEDETVIAVGLQRLSGRMMSEVVFFPRYSAGEETRAKLISGLCEAYIEQRLTAFEGDNTEKNFKAAISGVGTDISFRDFEEFREALMFLSKELRQPGGKRMVYVVTPDGEFGSKGFVLSDICRRRIEGLM